MYRALMPGWWEGMQGLEGYHLAEYLRCVFLESETALAVLTSAPGLGTGSEGVSLSANHPNPFSEFTELRFAIPTAATTNSNRM